jgi:hypothetical protein
MKYIVMHELGHALGLSHAGNDNKAFLKVKFGNTSEGVGDDLDWVGNTVMSYDNWNIHGGNYKAMDILTLWNIYGKDQKINTFISNANEVGKITGQSVDDVKMVQLLATNNLMVEQGAKAVQVVADSGITLSDVMATLKIYLGKSQVSNDVQFHAADSNDDGVVNLADVLGTLKSYLGKAPVATEVYNGEMIVNGDIDHTASFKIGLIGVDQAVVDNIVGFAA